MAEASRCLTWVSQLLPATQRVLTCRFPRRLFVRISHSMLGVASVGTQPRLLSHMSGTKCVPAQQ